MEPDRKPAGPVDNSASPFSTLKTLPFDAVRIRGGFWARRQQINRQTSLKHGYEMLKKAGNFHNLRMAAGLEGGEYAGRNFADENVYKWLEALGWELGAHPDGELERLADEAISLVQAAQQPDGYLNSYYQVVEPGRKWADLDFGHELYCAGHLFQAAVAHRRARGDGRLLQVALRLADHIDALFGPGRLEAACGHPEVEMALVELYRLTRERRYLSLAQFFVDQRGRGRMRGLASYGPEYHQDHAPLRQAPEAAGHAVRQMYLLSAAADLYLEGGEADLREALDRLWGDVSATKLYITGGLGSRYDGEAFGEAYELPPDLCYCETCAAIGSLMWNWRLLLITGESRYADLIERTLYNGILSSPALDGRHFFYVNPLMLRGGRSLRQSANRPGGETAAGRPEWHEVACCPPNIMRLFSSLAHYLATADAQGLQVHQYTPAEIRFSLEDGTQAALELETGYPWQGEVSLRILESEARPWELRLRLPEWRRSARLLVNGELVEEPLQERGYLVLQRAWRPGDRVQLELNMLPALVEPHPRLDAVRGCLAIQRGPLVYCLEAADHPGLNLLDVELDESAPLQASWREQGLPEGMQVVAARGYTRNGKDWEGRLYRPLCRLPDSERTPVDLTAIPYYAWAHRGLDGMRVWIPRAAQA